MSAAVTFALGIALLLSAASRLSRLASVCVCVCRAAFFFSGCLVAGLRGKGNTRGGIRGQAFILFCLEADGGLRCIKKLLLCSRQRPPR